MLLDVLVELFSLLLKTGDFSSYHRIIESMTYYWFTFGTKFSNSKKV